MNPPASDAPPAAGRRLADVPHSGAIASRPIAGPPLGMRDRRDRAIGWRSRDVARATVIIFSIYILGRLLWFANSLVFVVFLGVLFGLAVAGAVDRLERFHIRRGIASALIVFGTLAAVIGVGALMAPTLTTQFGELRKQIPTAVDRAERWVATHPNSLISSGVRSIIGTQPGAAGQGAAGQGAAGAARPATAAPPTGPPAAPGPVTAAASASARTAQVAAQAAAQAAAQVNNPQGGDPQGGTTAGAASPPAGAPSAADGLRARLGSQLAGAAKFLFPFLSSVGTVAAGLVLIIFLAIYIGAEPRLYHDGMMHLFPHRARNKAGEVLTEVATVLRKWLTTQLIAMAVIGTVTTVAMLVLRVKAAFALGFIAGLLEFVPTVGPLLAAIPAIAMGFVDGPEKALAVVAAYWGIQFLENNLLIPWLMRGGMDLPPALTLVAQALMTLIFGFLGLMVAVPLAAAALVPVKLLWVRDTIGDDIDVRDDGDDDADGGEGRDAGKVGAKGPRKG
jgi:predicted PurR-regulated permease PerM